MKIDNKNIVIGVLVLALGGYIYIQKKNKNKAGVSRDAVLNGAILPSNSASTDTSKADKEKADKEKESQEKANRERAEKETLDKANEIAIKLRSNQITMKTTNPNDSIMGNQNLIQIQNLQNEKMNLLFELNNLGYRWTFPNEFATKK